MSEISKQTEDTDQIIKTELQTATRCDIVKNFKIHSVENKNIDYIS